MRISKFKTKKIQESLKKLIKTLVENSFLAFLELLLIALIIGGIVFYQYSILAKKSPAEISEKPFQFQENAYQEILKKWQEKEKRFKEVDLKEYPNPFTEIEEEPPEVQPEQNEEPAPELPEPKVEELFQEYIVQKRDCLSWIAQKFGVTIESILKANPQIINPNIIVTGEKLKIPKLPD